MGLRIYGETNQGCHVNGRCQEEQWFALEGDMRSVSVAFDLEDQRITIELGI